MADPEITANIGSLDPLPGGTFNDTDLLEIERPRADPDPNDNYRATFAELTAAVAASLPPSDAAQTGDILITARNPGAGWLQCGHIYSQSSYGDLFGVVGLIPDGPPGATWTNIGSTGRAVNMYANIDADNIIGVGNGVIWRSSDGGESWDDETVAWNLTGVWATSSGVWATYGSGAGQTLLRSTDGGATFAAVARPSTSGTVNQVVEQDGRVFVLSGNSTSSRLFYSDNGGTSWTDSGEESRQYVMPLGNGVVISFMNNNTATRRSTNNGGSWANGPTLPSNGPVAGITHYSNGAGIGVVSGNAATMRTTDFGATFEIVATGISASNAPGHIIYAGGRLIQLARSASANHRYSDDLGVVFNDSGFAGAANLAGVYVGRLHVIAAQAAGTNAHRSLYRFDYDPLTQFRTPRVSGLELPLRGYIKA